MGESDPDSVIGILGDRIEKLEAENARLRKALADVTDIVHGLAGQQAMADDWWRERLTAALARTPEAGK